MYMCLFFWKQCTFLLLRTGQTKAQLHQCRLLLSSLKIVEIHLPACELFALSAQKIATHELPCNHRMKDFLSFSSPPPPPPPPLPRLLLSFFISFFHFHLLV